MLLVAQRVSSPGGRKIGINAFLYHHGAEASERIDWKALDIEKVLQDVPGELVAELIEVAPGGNSVAAFLDVLAPDGTPKDLILGSLRQGPDERRFDSSQATHDA